MGLLTHEIRFDCDKELKDISKRLHNLVAADFKLSAFNRKVFLLGISQISKQLAEKKTTSEILQTLFKAN